MYYLQFNESTGNITVNKNNSGTFASYQGTGYTRLTSNAPVFEGVSEKMNVTSSGVKDFTTAGVAMEFNSGTYPNGDVWISRGTINPDQLPNTDTNFEFYTIINNYGTNLTFSPLTSLSFYKNAGFGNYLNPSSYSLFKRGSNDFGSTWGTSVDNADQVSGTGLNTRVTFNTNLNVNSFSQFFLTNSSSALSRVNSEVAKNQLPRIVPNPSAQGSPISVRVPKSWVGSQLIIYDMSGKKVAEIFSLKSEENIILNLPKGAYIASYISKTNTSQEKFIIK